MSRTLLSMSRIVAEQVDEIHPASAVFDSSPYIAQPLCGEGWLACGSAAIAFDPICGDGVGNAVREAILASAVIRAAHAERDILLSHYRTRLLAGFKKHLEKCLELYVQGNCGSWWDEQIESTRRGCQWCADQLCHAPVYRYRLNGLALEPV